MCPNAFVTRLSADNSFMRLSISVIIIVCSFTVSSSLAQQAQPQSGEGAYGLLRRNGIAPNNVVLAEFRELNAGRFTQDGGLRVGVSYTLPISSIDEPLFGEFYRHVDIQGDYLAGTVWYLISGHGGDDSGAMAKLSNGIWIYEDEIAYDVMLRFGRQLISYGATVYFITQDDDGIRDEKYLGIDHDEKYINGKYAAGQNQRQRLSTRTKLINRYYKKHRGAYQRVVEFHVDKFKPTRQIDISFFYWSIPGERLARSLHQTMAEKYEEAQPGRGFKGSVRKEKLYTILNSIPVVAFIELGNIKHKGDQQRLIKPGNRQAVAEWLFEGFLVDVEKNR